MRRILSVAIAAVLGRAPPGDGKIGELPAPPVDPEIQGMQAKFRVVGVVSTHEHYPPRPRGFVQVGNICYVRQEEEESIRKAIFRNRAQAAYGTKY